MAAKTYSSTNKDVEAFARDLYDYLWPHHKLIPRTLEDVFTEKLKITEPVMRRSNFKEDIGKAVLCSQYLLRELCCYFFKHPKKGLGNSDDHDINKNISVVIFSWTCYRTDVFLKFIDTCAIIAEALLFRYCKLENMQALTEAPYLLAYFFDCNLADEFYGFGGWEELQKQASEKYNCIHSFLEPFIRKLTDPYELLIYDCQLIRCLNDSPVFFPVEFTEVCRYCLQLLDDPSYHIFNVLNQFSYYDQLRASSSSEQTAQDRESSEIGEQEKSQNSQSEFDNYLDKVVLNYLCLFVGKVEVSELNELRKAQKCFRDRMRRKRKSLPDDGAIKRSHYKSNDDQ